MIGHIVPQTLLFLSHIHEEKELAALIKAAIETEFSGFVEVFVSSDGTSIPVGANFLQRIENGLINCIGAVYLLSPNSVKRPWINFELGAVWIRNAMSVRNGNKEIPALPFCHSGMTHGNLPAPINNLNAILANQSASLEFAFRSLQTAVGGKGALRTNFDDLSANIRNFENKYTFGDELRNIFNASDFKIADLVSLAKEYTGSHITATMELEQHLADRMISLADLNKENISYKIQRSGLAFFEKGGAKPMSTIEFSFNREFLLKHYKDLAG